MGWVASLLLESPLPPPRWLLSGNERRAQAGIVVRRLFERRARHTPWHEGHYLHDLGRAYPLFGAGRVVPAAEVEEALGDELGHLNPPLVQGWASGLAFLALLVMILAMRGLAEPENTRAFWTGAAMFVGAPALWLASQLVMGIVQREIELCQHGVAVRRWSDVWLHRPGRVLDEPDALCGTLTAHGVRLVGATGSAVVATRLWPPSAREALQDELESWGIRFGNERAQHRQHRRRQRAGPAA